MRVQHCMQDLLFFRPYLSEIYVFVQTLTVHIYLSLTFADYSHAAMLDADIGCSLGASDALTTARLQGDPAAASLLLQLQEYIHSQGFNLLLVIQLLTIIGLVALAIWVRVTIASIRSIINKDPEHYTTCLEELLRSLLGCSCNTAT